MLKSCASLTTRSNDSLIAEILLLRAVQDIKDFEALLHDMDEAVTQFREFLLKIGGNNPRDNIHRAFSKIFITKCAMNYSWKDICNNFKISDLYFIKIMRKITLQHSSLTEAEFDNITATFRQAKEAEGRKRNTGTQGRKRNTGTK
ncbi:hypothetical protein ACFW04_013176 [Cataglyphis niger]